MNGFPKDDRCVLLRECTKYHDKFREGDAATYQRLLQFCEAHPVVLLAPLYSEHHAWTVELKNEFCNCVRTLTNSPWKSQTLVERASSFEFSIPLFPQIISVSHKQLLSLSITINDIPGYHTSRTTATLADYQGLFKFAHAHPYVITFKQYPPAFFTSAMFVKLYDLLDRFFRDDPSLLYLCASEFAARNDSDYFPRNDSESESAGSCGHDESDDGSY